MTLAYVQINEDIDDGSGAAVNGTATFTASATVYDTGEPVAIAGLPVQAQIVNGQMSLLTGQPVRLLPNDTDGLVVQGRTGFWLWHVDIQLNGPAGAVETDGWDFYLPSTPDVVDLYALAGTGLPGGGGMQNPMTTAGDMIDSASAGVPQRLPGNTSTTPEVLTSTGTGSAATTPAWQSLAELGIASAAFEPSSAFDASGAAATAQSNAEAASVSKAGDTMLGKLAPKVVQLSDGPTIAVNAGAGNDFFVTLAGNRTILAPSSALDGQKITFELIQDGTGSRTVTWTSGTGGYAFGSGTAPTLSTAAGATDQVAFRYSARKQAWLFLGSDGGF